MISAFANIQNVARKTPDVVTARGKNREKAT
jgi:hypothetical protein